MIPFGDYLPDLPSYGNPGALSADGVLPDAVGYRPFPDAVAQSPSLSGICLGATSLSDNAGTSYTFAGDAGSLYNVKATGVTDISVAGGYSTSADDAWEFVRWGNQVIATNYADAVQGASLSASVTFAALITSTDKPKARHIAVVGDFVVLGNVSDDAGVTPHRVRWSAQNDPTDFDESVTTQADFQDLQGNGGAVQKIVPAGDYAMVFRERSITRMTYVGGQVIFQFDEVEQKRGAGAYKNAVCHLGRIAFYLSDDGFYMFDGVTSTPIGANKVDRTVLADINPSYPYLVAGAVDPEHKHVYWSYASNDSNTPDSLVIYDWVNRKWSTAGVGLYAPFQHFSEGYTLEGLDAVNTSLDALPYSLDSKAWQGGVQSLAGFNTANQMATFTGSNLAATLYTGEFQPVPGRMAMVTSVRPVVEGGGTVYAQVQVRDFQEQVGWTTSEASLVGATGWSPVRVTGRYCRVGVTINAGGSWTHAVGVDDVLAVERGKR